MSADGQFRGRGPRIIELYYFVSMKDYLHVVGQFLYIILLIDLYVRNKLKWPSLVSKNFAKDGSKRIIDLYYSRWKQGILFSFVVRLFVCGDTIFAIDQRHEQLFYWENLIERIIWESFEEKGGRWIVDPYYFCRRRLSSSLCSCILLARWNSHKLKKTCEFSIFPIARVQFRMF